MTLGFRARVNLALGLGLALLLALGTAGYLTIDAFLTDAQQERKSQEAMLVMESMATHLKTAESWQRKYIITAHQDDLKAYQVAVIRVRSALARTRKMEALGNDKRDLDALAIAIEQRLANMELAVRARQQSGFDAASVLVGGTANSLLRERIDGLIEQIRASEIATVQASRAETEAGARAMRRMLVAGGVLAIMLVGWSMYLTGYVERMKSEFVSTVSHELRTPLTSIRGSLKLIAAGVAGEVPDKAKPLVGIALDNCERLVRLVNDILDLDKLGTGQLRLEAVNTPLEPLLRTAATEMGGYAAQHEVGIEVDVTDQTLQAEVDPGRLTQVIASLMSNAVRFSPRGGTVRVRLAREESSARIEVRDEGPGIPEEFRGRIFQRFSQADASTTRQKSGSGLGLSVSMALVERMKGSIGFRSEPGDTTFYVLLPLQTDAIQ